MQNRMSAVHICGFGDTCSWIQRERVYHNISNVYMSFSLSCSAVQLVVEAADSATAESHCVFSPSCTCSCATVTHCRSKCRVHLGAGAFSEIFPSPLYKGALFWYRMQYIHFVYPSAHQTFTFGTAFHILQARPCGGLCCLQLHTLHGTETYEWMFWFHCRAWSIWWTSMFWSHYWLYKRLENSSKPGASL